jgi:hypothetical protein
VTTEAIAGQDWLHVLIEINLPRTLRATPALVPAATAEDEECSYKAQGDCQGSTSRF